MVNCGCGLHPNPAKVPNFQYRAWLYSMDQKFHGDDGKNPKKPQNIDFETWAVSIWKILYSTNWLFWCEYECCEYEKRKKLPKAFEKNILSQKTVKKPVFLRFFGPSSSGRWYFRPEFQKLVEQKLFAIMKGNFSALAVKRIREKSKNDPSYVVHNSFIVYFEEISKNWVKRCFYNSLLNFHRLMQFFIGKRAPKYINPEKHSNRCTFRSRFTKIYHFLRILHVKVLFIRVMLSYGLSRNS
jgi:hypothetical protein